MLLAFALALVLTGQRVAAQEMRRFVRVEPAPPSASAPARLVDLVPITRRPWVRPIASLVVPGSGQLLANQSRGIAYLAVELWVMSRAIASGRQGNAQAAQYRQLAYDVARSRFSAVRVDGPFEYYETMEKFVESGRYDADPGAPFLPEQDSTTFNGSVWRLARHTFFVNPDSAPDPASAPYLAALAFYQSRATGGQFRWSWRGARLEQDVYRGAIRASDDAFRRRTNYLGALVLNHLASAIDALISARAAQRSAAVPRLGFRSAPEGVTLVWTGRF